MPLASRINKASNEPKNKRAKTERKQAAAAKTATTTPTRSTRQSAAAAAANSKLNMSASSSSAENDDSLTTSPTLSGKTTESNSLAIAAATNGMETVEITAKKNAKKPTIQPVVEEKKEAKLNGTTSAANHTAASNVALEDTVMTDITNHNETAAAASDEIVKPRDELKPGNLLAVGENLSNQLGLGLEVNDRKKPQIVKDMEDKVVQIAAGGMHSACLSEDGDVYTFGCNDEFALGRDNDEDIDRVDLPEKCIEVTAGDSHCAALSKTGVVYAWGTFRDGSGVLGLEQKKIAKTPMKFKLREKVTKISSGADHLVFLTISGEVYTAGNSEHGQLGRVSKYNSCRGGRRGYDMILVPGLVRIAKRKELNGHKQVEDIWTSAYCTFLKIKDADVIIGFGLNNCFQLGAEDAENRYQPDILQSLKFESKLRKVVGGMHHTLFLDTNGHVYALGSHIYGALGLGKLEANVSKPTRLPDLNDIVDIAANTNVSYAIDRNGKVYSWGTNYSKQLGQDTEDDYYSPTRVNSKQLDARDIYSVSIGGQHSLFIGSDEKDKDSDSE